MQAALFIAAISTLIQLFPLGGKIGSGLPVIMGVSFAYLPSMQAIAGNFDIATILGAQLIGGIVAVFVGIFVKKLRMLFPPLITGTVVFTIGLSLYPTAVKYMAGGASSPNYGAWQNWLVGFITLAVVIALNHFAKGILKLASILIGMIVGYIVSGFFGMIDFSAVGSAGMFQIPQPMYFGMKFEVSAIVTMVLLFVINSVQAIGDFSATTGGGLDREPTDKELLRRYCGIWYHKYFRIVLWRTSDSYFQPKCGNCCNYKGCEPHGAWTGGSDYSACRVRPKFSALLTTIPQCVLGGATISVFASIAMTGIKLVVQQPLTYRSTSIIGLAVALGMGITQCSDALASFPAWVTTVLENHRLLLQQSWQFCSI